MIKYEKELFYLYYFFSNTGAILSGDNSNVVGALWGFVPGGLSFEVGIWRHDMRSQQLCEKWEPNTLISYWLSNTSKAGPGGPSLGCCMKAAVLVG